jgi:hypothetical protein
VFASEAFRELERAWKSGEGRTTQSIVDYLGIAKVLPWKSQLVDEAARVPISKRALELATLSETVSEASPEFAGLALFARTLWVAALAAENAEPGSAPRIEVGSQDELLAAAEKLMKGTPTTQVGKSALLGVAAVLSQQRDVRDLYRKLEASAWPEQAFSRLGLGAWLSAAWQDRSLFEDVKATAIDVLGSVDTDSLARSELVLLLAETANVVDPNVDNQRTLEQVSQELSRAGVPDHLRLRAALQLAHLHQTKGQPERAIGLLREITRSSPELQLQSPGSLLHLLSRARLVLLETEQQSPAERLLAFDRVFAEQTYPPSVSQWQRRWQAELSHQSAVIDCAKRWQCLKDATERRARVLQELESSSVPLQARLLARGVLPLGALEMSIDYEPNAGLRPMVHTEPAFVFLPPPAAP